MDLKTCYFYKLMNGDNIIEIIYRKRSGEYIKHKYNSIKFERANSKVIMFIDNIHVKKNNSYSVKYKCLNCDRINIVNLSNFIGKVERCITKCNMCSGIYDSYVKMDWQYQNEYFKKYPTEDEMKFHWKKILSIQNDKFSNMDNYDYYPVIKMSNSNSFLPFFKDYKRDVFEKPINIKFKCENCTKEFMVRDLTCIKNKLKIICNDCSHDNIGSLKIHSLKNCVGKKVSYFTKFQLRFIKFCNKNEIVVQNKGTNYYVPSKNITICLLKKGTINIDGVICVNPKKYVKFIKNFMSR